MIRINLLGDDTVIDTSGTWIVIGYLLSFFFVVIGFVCWNIALSSSVETQQLEVTDLERRLASIREITKEVRDLENKKKELAEKTSVISTLKKNKYGPVRVLDDLNNSIPERAWVTEVKESAGVMRISGLAIDNQTVASFAKQLEESPFYQGVAIGEARGEDKLGAKVVKFVLQAKINYGGFPPEEKPSPAKE